MKFLEKLISPLHHTEETTYYLLKSLGVKVTKFTLIKKLQEHPEFPSLLAIGDVMSEYGVKNIAVKLNFKEWGEDLAAPFLVQITNPKTHASQFVVVTNYNETNVETYWTNTNRIKTFSCSEFEKIYKGVVMAIEVSEVSGEPNFKANSTKQRQKDILNVLIVYSIPIATISACIALAFSNPISKIFYPILFTVVTMIGVFFCVLLLIYEIDEFNPVVNQICKSGTAKKVNCSAILSSKASSLFGISWGSFGFTYFMGMLLLLIIGGNTNHTLTTLSWLNIASLPYVLFSILYQWKIAKQWCLLCISVQLCLLSQFIISLLGGFYNLSMLSAIPIQTFIGNISVFAFIFSAVVILMPALKNAKDGKQKNIELQKIKLNSKIFEALLTRQKLIEQLPDGLGISLGNPKGRIKLIKVCNPYCSPCAKAHPIIDELVKNNDEIHLQIIFALGSDEKPARHLLSIADQNDRALLSNALNDWYNAPIKDYEQFSHKYPASNLFDKYNNQIKEMNDWCNNVQISFTPTFFINGRQLPEMYSITELNYLLK